MSKLYVNLYLLERCRVNSVKSPLHDQFPVCITDGVSVLVNWWKLLSSPVSPMTDDDTDRSIDRVLYRVEMYRNRIFYRGEGGGW